MKQTKQARSKSLHLNTETVRTLKVLSPEQLGDIHGGQNRTSFSCGNICVSINAC